MKPLLILKTGNTLPAVGARFGDFDTWFRAALDPALPVAVVDATTTSELPPAHAYLGVIVTGSPAMVSHREPWSENAATWLRQAFHNEIPLLGVCYGHQLLAHALGGEVGPNPSGRHMGTVRIELNAAGHCDALLAPLSEQPLAHVTHMERVLQPPPGATVLATVSADPHHALRFGPHAWGVQFHPEFNAAIMRAYVEERRQQIEQESLNADAILTGLQEAPVAQQLLNKFANLCLAAHNNASGQHPANESAAALAARQA